MNLNKLKSVMSVAAVAAVLGLGSNMIAPPEAQAALVTAMGGGVGIALFGGFIILDGGVCGGDHRSSTLGCLFGIAFLDQKVERIPPLNLQDLRDNGYREAQIERVREDAEKFQEAIRQKGGFQVGSHDSESAIRDRLKNFVPEVSDEFLNVVAPKLFYLSQSPSNAGDPAFSNSDREKPVPESAPRQDSTPYETETMAR